MSSQALGLIETFGYIGAVEAADICLKAANVKLIGLELVTGGLVMVEVTGDVGAVKAAIEAASSAVEKVGRLISAHVIPRPAAETAKLFAGSSENITAVQKKKIKNECEAASGNTETALKSEKECEDGSFLTLGYLEELSSMKVVELRVLARKLDGIKMERNHIKYATRKELLEAILEHHERKS
ncbi:MAG TPA: BMC domain-containing protein [Clostridia bacterium]|nr:BMC domain-containing protein [Clostridia bacterium]